MQQLAALDQQRVVGDLLRQRVLEDVFDLGRGRLFVDELAGLQGRQSRLQFPVHRRSDLPDQRQRRLPAHYGEGLDQLLVLTRQPVDTRGQYPLHGRRQPQLRERARNLDGAVAYEGALVEQRLHHLLDEEWIALSALDYHTFERIEFDPIAQQRREHL